MTSGEIGAVFRREAGQALATLIRLLGDFDRWRKLVDQIAHEELAQQVGKLDQFLFH